MQNNWDVVQIYTFDIYWPNMQRSFVKPRTIIYNGHLSIYFVKLKRDKN